MEQREPAPIWAAVFGRQSLRFVWNTAALSNLTTFHCLYPKVADPHFAAALTACLNSRLVQQTANHQLRVYGGGLLKFEPRDLLSIQVPDLPLVPRSTLKLLSAALERIDQCCKAGSLNPDGLYEELDGLVLQAANEAGNVR
jgi:adenine-specific DNA-methyltransferase